MLLSLSPTHTHSLSHCWVSFHTHGTFGSVEWQSSSLVSFPISAREWDFARRHESTYHILRVMRVGRPDMTVIKLSNPHQLALQGNIKLYLAPRNR